MLTDVENVKDNQRKEISIRNIVIRAYEQKSLHLQ